MSIRTERVGASVRDALGQYLLRAKPSYLDGMVTVVSVKMSPDLSIAKVYVSIYNSTTDRDILIARMNTHAPELRKHLAPVLQMRRIPEFRFYRDDTLDTIDRINELLKSVRTEEPEGSGDDEHTDETA